MPIWSPLVYLTSHKATLRGSLNKDDVQVSFVFLLFLPWNGSGAAGPASLISAVMSEDQSLAFGGLSIC